MSHEGKVRFIGVVESDDDVSVVKLYPEYLSGLKGIEDFSHLIILYWLNRRDSEKERSTLTVIPRKHTVEKRVGVFVSRSPSRPNPVGLCVVELLKVEGSKLYVEGLDAFEGTPVIDIKPYIPRADSVPNAKVPDWTLRGPKT